MNIGIMQPYFFPYIGYFQLINKVDKFVFYNDVNFIKKGWINRNKILVNKNEKLFTVPLQKPSQNKLICEIAISNDQSWKNKFLATFDFNYKKKPYYNEVKDIITQTINTDYNDIGSLSASSIKNVSAFLEIDCIFEESSDFYANTKKLGRAERLIEISKLNNSSNYINAIGGLELYNKNFFSKRDVNLLFLKPEILEYMQSSNTFIPNLSILDVIANLGKTKTIEHLKKGKLI